VEGGGDAGPATTSAEGAAGTLTSDEARVMAAVAAAAVGVAEGAGVV
jgi:hypothetical protein